MKKPISIEFVPGTSCCVWRNPETGGTYCDISRWIPIAPKGEVTATISMLLRSSNEYALLQHRVPTAILDAINAHK